MAKPSHAIDPALRKIIYAQLEELERKHDIRILFACGSALP